MVCVKKFSRKYGLEKHILYCHENKKFVQNENKDKNDDYVNNNTHTNTQSNANIPIYESEISNFFNINGTGNLINFNFETELYIDINKDSELTITEDEE